MEICSVTLKNFKTHAECHYEFRPGVNAICGENGAGKTSILEAIAWALFDHSDYTRGELIRTGSKSAQVAVAFISHLDGRVYEVRRCTRQGYDIHDPQLNLNLGLRKQEDVQAWMRQHLGVAPQTDLARLFAETIGIPQGTFSADFLKRPVERKKIFDPILKVEEYKQVYDQMRELETYAKAQVTTLVQQLASYEQQLADWDELQQQATLLNQAIAQDRAQVEQLGQVETQLQQQVNQIEAIAQQVQALETQIHPLDIQIASKTEALERLEAQCASAHRAVEICRTKRDVFNTYEAAQETLKQLSAQRRQQQIFLKQRDALCQQLRDREGQVSQLQGQLATFAQLRQGLEQWQDLVPKQEHLEAQLQQLQQTLQSFEPIKLQRQTLQAQCAQRSAQIECFQHEITAIEPLQAQVEQLPQWESEQQLLQTQLSRLQAGQGFADDLQTLAQKIQVHSDRHHQEVVTAQTMLAPFLGNHPKLSFASQVLEAGAVLHRRTLRSLRDLFEPLTDPAAMTVLADKLKQLTQAIQDLQPLQQQLATLPLKQQQLADSQQELLQMQQQIETCDRQLVQQESIQAQYVQIELELRQLNDPKGNLRLLQQQLQQEANIQLQLSQFQTSLMTQQEAITSLDGELATFAEIDVKFEHNQQLLQTHQDDYQIYLRHRNEANEFRILHPQRLEAQAKLAAFQADLQQVQADLQQVQAQLQRIQQTYDAQQLIDLKTSLAQVQHQQAQLQGGLFPKQSQLHDLNQRLQARQALAEQQTRDRQILTQKQSTLQFIGDSRHIFNQSGPRITKYYLAEVSLEADKLFRELLNRDEVSLEWTEDYEIRVKERGYWRSFKSLSGGEQMCAALAVRLALLRVLADINIAFFDEPTTNMDQLRRRQLAEAIGNLKAFRQLIVISHDDTFEHATEHVIRVERNVS